MVRSPHRQKTHDTGPAAAVTDMDPALLISGLPLPTVILDVNGDIRGSNQQFDTHWIRPDDRRRGSFIDALEPAEQAIFAARLVAVVTGAPLGDPLSLKLPYAPDGPKWACVSMTRYASNLPSQGISILLQLTDITALTQELADVSSREARWNAALFGAAAGVWDHHLPTNTMYYSDTWYRLRGLSPGDPIPLTTETWLECLHPDDRAKTLHNIERQVAGDLAYAVFEYRERHKDGHWVWIECRGSCIEWDADGNPVRMIGTDTDISLRKQAEEQLVKVSRRLELALETSSLGIYEGDLDEGTVHWDDRAIQIYGLEGRGRSMPRGASQALVHPEDLETARNYIAEVIANGGTDRTNQFRILRHDDGQVRHLRTRATTFIDNNGRRRLIGVTWDVSEDVSLHEALDRAKTQAEAHNRALEGAKARIEHIALHDHLTGLPNRRYLDEMLDRVTGECAEEGGGLAVLHIDLDRFKQINDTLGHSAGDMMLQHAAGILKANIRSGDFVARIGGDEFVFLARFDGARNKLAELADRIIAAMRRPVTFEGNDVRFGASIGIAYDSGKSLDGRQILLNADIALYHAKNRGRNRHEFFSRDTHNRIIAAKRLSDELLRGLERGEFVPCYQFQFDARTLDISGAETLARWNHPVQGILTPDKFLATAQDLDVVAEIDAIILEKALEHFRCWKADGLGVPKVSVNVSSRRLHDPALRRKLANLAIEPGTLSFELLESIFLDDYDEQVVENLAHLRELGIDIEIDDFGTGHASIVSLLKLSPDTLKIDRELVRNIPVSAEQRKLVGSIIDIGHSLDIKVVAEGVETVDHVHILRALGCDVLQGYGLARAMDFSATGDFIKNQGWRATMPLD